MSINCNGDRIRSMNNEELAKFLAAWHCSRTCTDDGCCPDKDYLYCRAVKGDYCNGLEVLSNGIVADIKEFLFRPICKE